MWVEKLKIKHLYLFLVLFFIWSPGFAYAQAPSDELQLEPELEVIDWRELQTENFTIVYAESVVLGEEEVECACGVEHAEYYATFIDSVYQDLTAVFGVELELPINLRLFPTEDSYYRVNPLARRLTGVVAHALNSRDEIAIALPRTLALTDQQLLNNIRHEMAHLFASTLSDGKLSPGFQEGIAQYIEQPAEDAAQEPALLEQAVEQDRLLRWEEFDQPEQVYGDTQVAYPQSLAIVSFLVDRYGLETFIEFLKASATEPGYRSALELAYTKSAKELEKEWLAYLPEYFDGRWRINAIYTFDLGTAAKLVDQGAYTDAEAELTEIISLLEATNQADTLAEAEALLERVHQGQTAGALADGAREALLDNDYALALEKGNAAIAAYNALDYDNRIPEIQNYIYRAELGQQALSKLNEGENLLDSLRFFEAENVIYEATALLQTLDNQIAVERGQTLLVELNWRKKLVVYALLVVALLTLIANGLRRVYDRLVTKPLEVEFT